MDWGSWHCTEDRDQDIPMEKKCKKSKWLSGEALKIAYKKREVKSKGEKERYKHLNAKFQRIARRDKKAFLSNQCKEIEENNKMGKVKGIKRCKVPVLNKSHGYKVQHCECSYIAISGAHTREKHPKTIASGVLPLWWVTTNTCLCWRFFNNSSLSHQEACASLLSSSTRGQLDVQRRTIIKQPQEWKPQSQSVKYQSEKAEDNIQVKG